MRKEVGPEGPSRQERIEDATQLFIKAFDRVMKIRSVEEDLDRAANSLIELGVQPFHVIMPLRSFKEPVPIEGALQEKVRSRQSLMKLVGVGDHRFEEELTRAVILEWADRGSSTSSFPGSRDVPDRETLTRMAALVKGLKAQAASVGVIKEAPFREGFLSNAFVRTMVRDVIGSGPQNPDSSYRPGYQAAPANTNWSYWFDWLYFLMDHPTGARFYEPPQCMNCGRCLDELGVQFCPECGEDPWQWWFQWFYARHAPEDTVERSWDLFQLHTFTEGKIFHPRTEGWISSLTHIPVLEEGRFRLDVVSKAVVMAPGLWATPGGVVDLDIWHSVAFGPYPATSIRHPVYLDDVGRSVEFAHRSPFERLIMRVNLDSGETKMNFGQGVDRYSLPVSIRSSPSIIALGASTLDTGEVRDGRKRWSALTPVIEGPGAFIVREEVTYLLEDPSANGFRSIFPSYNGQPGGWFDPLMFRVIEVD